MDDMKRRALLRRLGIGGMVGLAGCQGRDVDDEATVTRSIDATTSSDTATETETSRGTATAVTADLETSVEKGTAVHHVVVTGRISSKAGIQTVTVEAGDDRRQLEVGGESEYSLDVTLDVEGGQAYRVTVAVVDSAGNTSKTRLETGTVPPAVDPLEPDRLVGAHYYSWYEMHQGHENWTDRTVSTPVLGEYASDDPAVVDQHLAWCLEHGIEWLSVSWWGPGSGSDTALDGTLTERDLFGELKFSILYETVGRLEDYDYDLDDPGARERLRSDFEYLAEKYFQAENYLYIDGEPVVYFYVSNHLHGDIEAAFAEATANLDTEIYVLAGVPFGSAPGTYPVMAVADGITSYNPYSAREDIEAVFHENYEQGNKVLNLGASIADVDLFPVAIPGFNDTGLPAHIREDNPILSSSPDRFRRVCEQVQPHLADSEAVLVTSFNEWYEDTQLEPGKDFGTDYLELARDELVTGPSTGFEPVGATVRLAFNETIVPAEVNPDSSDTRALAFMAGGLTFLAGDEVVASFDIGAPENEPLLLEGAYGASANDSYTWRWFGGRNAETVLFVEADLTGVDTAVLTGEPMRSDRIEADVFFDGEQTDHVAFDSRDGTLDDYELDLR
ncbi:glycoside hydrolase family 99-like domain-containing protein [Haloarchaeobius amylolyticus]|uniref:glycoside hydrolase family 99-like domain-containing protein n=1 Tax=Haloarchaeobius amylolyticus TaxID=1198296 RepID=UPI00227117E1|nr:glycoside hydrolase family 99-like domain-containing protein [Haloarchaeobius amylolyticus]